MGRQKESLEARVARWRAEHGGRGVRWPEDLWIEAVAAARVEGVGPVAARLGVARDRLTARLSRHRAEVSRVKKEKAGSIPAVTEFVEIDTRGLVAPPMTGAFVRFESGGGKRVELEIRDAAVIDVVALFQAFWARGA